MGGNDIVTIIGAIIGSGAITALVNGYLNRRKRSAEGRSEEIRGELQVVDSYQGLIEDLRKYAENLKVDITRLEKKVRELQSENTNLKKRISELERG